MVGANDVRCDFSDSSSSCWIGVVCENSYVIHGRVPLRRRYVEEGVIGCDFSSPPRAFRARVARHAVFRARDPSRVDDVLECKSTSDGGEGKFGESFLCYNPRVSRR